MYKFLLSNKSASIHIAILQEPSIPVIPKQYHIFPPLHHFQSQRALIMCHKPLNASFIPQLSTPDFCIVKLRINNQDSYIVSIYCDIHQNVDDTLSKLSPAVLRSCIIGIDTNAHSYLWGAENLAVGAGNLKIGLIMKRKTCLCWMMCHMNPLFKEPMEALTLMQLLYPAI